MIKIHTAQKDHKCSLCGRRIPKGEKYWRDYQEDEHGNAIKDHKEHTNCLLYVSEEVIWRRECNV